MNFSVTFLLNFWDSFVLMWIDVVHFSMLYSISSYEHNKIYPFHCLWTCGWFSVVCYYLQCCCEIFFFFCFLTFLKPENVPLYSKRTKIKLICHVSQCKWAKLDLKIIALTPKPNSSVQFSCSVVSNSLRPHELQHTRPPWPSPTPGVYPNSCPSSRWCHPALASN